MLESVIAPPAQWIEVAAPVLISFNCQKHNSADDIYLNMATFRHGHRNSHGSSADPWEVLLTFTNYSKSKFSRIIKNLYQLRCGLGKPSTAGSITSRLSLTLALVILLVIALKLSRHNNHSGDYLHS